METENNINFIYKKGRYFMSNLLINKQYEYNVKILNDLNDFGLNDMGKNEIILFFLLIWHIKEAENKNVYTLRYSDLIKSELFGRISVKQMRDIVDRLSDKLYRINGKFMSQTGSLAKAHFFDFYFTDTDTFEMVVNPRLKGMVIGISKNFTILNITQLSKLKSPYSIKLGKKLMQYYDTGNYYVTVEGLSDVLGLSSKTRTDSVTSRFIEPAITELTAFYTNLAYAKHTEGKGGRIVGFLFTFKPERRRKISDEEKAAIEKKVGLKKEQQIPDESTPEEEWKRIGPAEQKEFFEKQDTIDVVEPIPEEDGISLIGSDFEPIAEDEECPFL